MKKDYLNGVGDTLDLVPIGAWNGHGKRTGVYGGFLLACYDPDTESFQTICKVSPLSLAHCSVRSKLKQIGTGFSDQQLSDFTAALKPTEIAKPKSYFVYTSISFYHYIIVSY